MVVVNMRGCNGNGNQHVMIKIYAMRPVLIILSALLTLSCKKNKDIDNLKQWDMTNVEGATAGNTNQVISLTVSWPFRSGCDALDLFKETRQGNTVSIKAYGHTTAGFCTDDAGIKTKTYGFKANVAGTYELRFINTDSSAIVHTITIH
jgi:hypothetical protein